MTSFRWNIRPPECDFGWALGQNWFLRIPQEWPESSRNQWGMIKTSIERFSLIFKLLQSALQNFDMKRGPRSEMMSQGSPCFANIWVIKWFAKSSALSVVLLGTNIPPFVSWHAVTIIASLPSELGSSTIWSMDMEDQGLSPMGSGLSSP